MSERVITPLLLVQLFLAALGLQECLNDLQHRKFFMVQKCRRSDLGVISRNNLDSLKECMDLAREKNGLALNYSPADAKRNETDETFYNCLVLGCAESTNFTTLIKDPAYDYYSAYGNFTDLINSTCVKSLGMFRLYQEKENYTTAIDTCQSIGGDLAHILTEARTNALSAVVAGIAEDWFRVAYVGLDDSTTEGLYETPLGDPIDCYKWRAWSPGHPKNVIKSDDCVVLDTEKSWKVVNCRSKLPFLCEYYNTAPSPNRTANQDCDELPEEEERKNCKEAQRVKNKRNRKRRDRCDDE